MVSTFTVVVGAGSDRLPLCSAACSVCLAHTVLVRTGCLRLPLHAPLAVMVILAAAIRLGRRLLGFVLPGTTCAVRLADAVPGLGWRGEFERRGPALKVLGANAVETFDSQ